MEIIKDLSVFAIVSGLITFLIRGFINKYFEKNADKFRGDLQKEFEKFKNELNLQQIKATRYHEKELEVLSDLFEKITIFKNHLIQLTSTIEIKLKDNDNNKDLISKCKDNISESYKNFSDFYDAKRIFIPKHTCDLIDEFKSTSSSVIFNYHYRDDYYDRDSSSDSKNIKSEIRDKMKNVTEILNNLELDFRTSINVIESNETL